MTPLTTIRRRWAMGAGGLVTGVAIAVCAGCSSATPPPADAPSQPVVSSAVGGSCPSPSTAAAPQLDPATLARVRTVVDSVAAHAWNPTALPSRGGPAGGVFINWRPTWDGRGAAASATNIQTSGSSDVETGTVPRHDPLADLLILRGVLGYLALAPADPGALRLACLLSPVVASEFHDYGVDRAWVYGQLVALGRLDPTAPWSAAAQRYAALLSTVYLDPVTGAERNPRSGTYRSDYAAETAAALVDAGTRFRHPAWTAQGARAALRLLTGGADPGTGLFPGVLRAGPGAGPDTVVDPMVKVGAQAQLLDALLTVFDGTHDTRFLAAVNKALGSLDSPGVGVVDLTHGGYFYAVDANGTNARTEYKETRQAWFLVLRRHLQRITGTGGDRTAQAEELVRDGLYRSNGQGYVYRVAPDLGEYVSSLNGVRLDENWISSEATGIALATLTGPLP